MDRLPPRTRAELIEVLAEAFEAALPDTVEEATRKIESMGIDPKALGKELTKAAIEALHAGHCTPPGRSGR